jgi:hypothetical protein
MTTTATTARFIRVTEWSEGIDGMSRVYVLVECPHCKIEKAHAVEFEGKAPKCWNCLKEVAPVKRESRRRTYNCLDVRQQQFAFAGQVNAVEGKARELMTSLKPTEAEQAYMIDTLGEVCRASVERAVKRSADSAGALNLLLESEPFNMHLMLVEVERARG